MKALAPGKIILSGEHAVVYGSPALAMAIDLNARSVVSPGKDNQVSLDLPDIREKGSYTLRALRALQQRALKNYHLFLAGDLGIKEVLMKPVDLMQFGFIIMLDGLHIKLTKGLNLHTESTIPIGCGLGSSAATILSALRAVGHYFRVDFKPEWYYEYSLEAEKMQHGHPSGVDSYISLHGGCALFQSGTPAALPLPRITTHIVNTGTPETSTGESVEQVRRHFARSAIWSEFEEVTFAMRDAIASDRSAEIARLIGENQRLLNSIGVVPERVQNFIEKLEEKGIFAKVCGSGAVRGDAGGTVLVCAEEPPAEICEEYGYSFKTIRGDPLGTRLV